ncbi:MAG TPA: DEAD/DEAH box helicase family protein, partial [Opitutaceae bacterium]
PVLYVAPTVEIVRQTYRVFAEIFGADRVGRVDGTAYGNERSTDRFIVITTAPGALRLDSAFYKTRGVLIFDEFHHGAAESWHRISLAASHIFHRFCFTGTHWRTAGDELAMEAVCSRVIFSCDVADLVPQYIARPWVCYTPIRGAVSGRDWRVAYERGIVEHDERNAIVVRFADQLASEGISTLVLANRRAHADALASSITGSRVAKGGEGVLTSKSVADFVAGAFPVLVGTSVLGEGVDVPNARAVIYAGGLGGSVQMMQSYYRCLTAADGKDFGRVYDFHDMHHETLARHARERIALATRNFPPNTVNVY